MRSEPLTRLADFDLGVLRIRPARRMIEGPAGSVAVEPLVMQLLIELSHSAGRVVTRREIFDRCWGAAPVGDDSLNRIVAALRRALDDAGPGLATIKTVPRTGYLLRLCRYAAEYAEPVDALGYLAECEASAARSLAIDPGQTEARVALATVAPLFGRWLDARARLGEIVRDQPDSFTATHELAIVEMAAGRICAAKALVDDLLDSDPLAACLCYKSIYQHWSTTDLPAMDHVADRAIQMWPSHPAVWIARLWTLAYTGRAQAALRMLEDEAVRPPIPPPALQFLRAILGAVSVGTDSKLDEAAALSRQVSQTGPAQAIGALFALGLLQRPDEQFDIAMSYYVRQGAAPVPIRHMHGEPSINDQHRRVTQILFTPACAVLRADPRFTTLCDRIGLSGYWAASGLEPDFRSLVEPN